MMPLACAAARPSATSAARANASRQGRGACASRPRKLTPSSSSLTAKRMPCSTPKSCSTTIFGCASPARQQVFSLEAGIIAQDFGFRPALCQKAEQEVHAQTRALDDRLAHEHLGINNDAVVVVHDVKLPFRDVDHYDQCERPTAP